MQAPSSDSQHSQTLRFTGSGSAYFPLWLSNSLAVILTCGLFYPWAVVRSRRYFYQHTWLGQRHFNYHARGWVCFPGWLGVMIFSGLAMNAGFAGLNGLTGLTLMVALLTLLFLPALLTRGYRFQLQQTSLGGVCFDCPVSGSVAWASLAGVPLLAAMTLIAVIWLVTLLAPSVVLLFHYLHVFFLILFLLIIYCFYRAQWLHLCAAHLRYGRREFSLRTGTPRLTGLFLAAACFGVLCYGLFSMMLLIVLQPLLLWEDVYAPHGFATRLFNLHLPIIPAFAVSYGWLLAMVHRHLYGTLSLQGGITFASHARAGRVMWITFSNMLLCGITLGLYWPWAKVRLVRYLQENTVVSGALDRLTAGQGPDDAKAPDSALISWLSRGCSLLPFTLWRP